MKIGVKQMAAHMINARSCGMMKRFQWRKSHNLAITYIS